MSHVPRLLRLDALLVVTLVALQCLPRWCFADERFKVSAELIVTIDGKRATGFFELGKQYGVASSPASRAEMDQAFDRSLVQVRRGQRAKFKVELARRGSRRDVTADPALNLEFPSQQARRTAVDEIQFEPEAGAPRLQLARMAVTYVHAASGETAFNQFLFKVGQ